jgi:hypothetical protein
MEMIIIPLKQTGDAAIQTEDAAIASKKLWS